MNFLNFFKKKPKKEGLEKALELGLITEEEFLKSKILRYQKALKELEKKK